MRRQLSLKDGSDWDVHQMRELLYQDSSVRRRLDLRQRRVYSVARCPFVRLMICTVFFRYSALGSTEELHIFEIWFSDKKLV